MCNYFSGYDVAHIEGVSYIDVSEHIQYYHHASLYAYDLRSPNFAGKLIWEDAEYHGETSIPTSINIII